MVKPIILKWSPLGKWLHHVALVAMVSGSQQTVVLPIIMTENSKKVDMYDFPVHDYTQGKNGSPYFSSIIGQCKWPSLSKKIVVIQKFCYHGNLMSHSSSLYRIDLTNSKESFKKLRVKVTGERAK